MRTLTRSAILALGLAGCFAFTSAAASAAVVTSAKAVGDPATAYTLSDGELTVASTDPALLSAVRGQRVLAMCASPGGAFLGPNAAVWGSSASSWTFALHAFRGTGSDTGDIIACSLASKSQGGIEELGGVWVPFSRAVFTPAGLFQFAEVPRSPVKAVAGAKLAAAASAFLRRVVSPARPFPSAQGTVTTIDAVLARHRLAQNVLYAATAADVTDPDALYVVGSGSDSTSLELAVLGSNGRPYAMQCHAKGLLGAVHEV